MLLASSHGLGPVGGTASAAGFLSSPVPVSLAVTPLPVQQQQQLAALQQHQQQQAGLARSQRQARLDTGSTHLGESGLTAVMFPRQRQQ